MLKIENTEVMGWEAAIRGMRNPMNSWEKSDSFCKPSTENCRGCHDYNKCAYIFEFTGKPYRRGIGTNDLDLMTRLRNAGTDHRKYLRMIVVYCDITAPLYWWSEYDTYKVGTVANSCSKMHKLLHKPFEMNDFSFDKLPGYKHEVKYFIPEVDEDLEVWKKTIEDEYYEVSNYGRIRHDGRILSGSIHDDGYIFVNIRGKQYAKHRVVAEAFISNPENKPFVNHIDGNKQNCMCSNLEWCTQSENVQHAHDMKLQPKGVSTYKGKFTEEQRNEIKKLWDEGILSKRQIAKKYDVSHTCINDIINDKYQYVDKVNVFETVARPIVDTLNELRDAWFSEDNSDKKKQIWYSILQLLPSSYNQKRTVMLNYEVLANIYKSRKNHKLDEWHTFCDWIKTLPYSELITGED
jgi:hypothetical protein